MVVTKAISTLPDYESIVAPQVVALIIGNGSGSKLLQAFLDNHEEIYMVPAYPLMYFYPHWQLWRKELKDNWNWKSLIDVFCSKHASVLDSRLIPGHNGLVNLGDNQDGHVEIDEERFRSALHHFLKDRPISSRTFLLAVHYAYAICNDEDLSKKKLLVYHIHSTEYFLKYLLEDFPDTKTIAMTRDPRPNIGRRFKGSLISVDDAKLNTTDALIYRRRAFGHSCKQVLNGLDILRDVPSENLVVIKHEDMASRLEEIIRALAGFLEIKFVPQMQEITFDGRPWWNDSIYGYEPTNKVDPRILSQNWQKTIDKLDWFVIEGVMFDILQKYRYTLFKYDQDNIRSKLALVLAILIPTQIERRVFYRYLHPGNHLEFLKAAIHESTGRVALKDYTWNATYLFKWTYIDLKLWHPRWYASFTTRARLLPTEGFWKWPSKAALLLSRTTYVSAVYGRFWWAIATYPLSVMTRWKLFYSALARRLMGHNFMADPIDKGIREDQVTAFSIQEPIS